jgi:uncharacterized protein (TIGR02145 family)
LKKIIIYIVLLFYYVPIFSQIVISPAFHAVQYVPQDTTYGVPCPGLPEFTDSRDGNVYRTVQIGEQCWMAKNLAYLPEITFEEDWGNDTLPQFAINGYIPGSGTETVAGAKATENYITYGVLYNWSAAMNGAESSSENPSGVQGICPNGWHLPSDDEWTELYTHLGEDTLVGGKLKESGTAHWFSPNTGATNESGFTALPGGSREASGVFVSGVGYIGFWWSATERPSTHAWRRYLFYGNSRLWRNGSDKSRAFSVRCIKD